MENIAKQVLEKIKEEKMKPKPRWEFIFKEYFLWFLAGLSLLIGSLAVAVIIHMLKNNDWDLYAGASDGLLSFIFITLPYFWLILLLAFAILSYYNFKNTKSGYRLHFRLLISASILSSIFLGILFFNLGLGREIDKIFSANLPFYEKYLMQRKHVWLNPERGFLAGKIMSDVKNKNFELRDMEDKIWLIHGQNCFISPKVSLKKFEAIKIMGERIDEHNFLASQIRPWIGPPGPMPCLTEEDRMFNFAPPCLMR
ncbi:MAG: hypothetical protein WC582_03060 [Patescibacteria group bacterium]|jgi:uncharacterized membrane protein